MRFSGDATEPVPFMRCYSSICRKTAGAGGYAINLGATTRSMKVTGKCYLGIYRARLQEDAEASGHASDVRRYFCCSHHVGLGGAMGEGGRRPEGTALRAAKGLRFQSDEAAAAR